MLFEKLFVLPEQGSTEDQEQYMLEKLLLETMIGFGGITADGVIEKNGNEVVAHAAALEKLIRESKQQMITMAVDADRQDVVEMLEMIDEVAASRNEEFCFWFTESFSDA